MFHVAAASQLKLYPVYPKPFIHCFEALCWSMINLSIVSVVLSVPYHLDGLADTPTGFV